MTAGFPRRWTRSPAWGLGARARRAVRAAGASHSGGWRFPSGSSSSNLDPRVGRTQSCVRSPNSRPSRERHAALSGEAVLTQLRSRPRPRLPGSHSQAPGRRGPLPAPLCPPSPPLPASMRSGREPPPHCPHSSSRREVPLCLHSPRWLPRNHPRCGPDPGGWLGGVPDTERWRVPAGWGVWRRQPTDISPPPPAHPCSLSLSNQRKYMSLGEDKK